VRDEFHEEVSGFVDRTNLRGRIVYYRIKENRKSKPLQTEPGMTISKLRIKPDSKFYRWIESDIRILEGSADILRTLKEKLDNLVKQLRGKMIKHEELPGKMGELGIQLNNSKE